MTNTVSINQPAAFSEGFYMYDAEKQRRAPADIKVVFSRIRLATIFVMAVLCWLVLSSCFSWGWVMSSSMAPTMKTGSGYVGSYISERTSLQRGDIVSFSPYTVENNYLNLPQEAQTDTFVKRIVGVPGDSVSICDNVLYINGVPQEEPYLSTSSSTVDFDEVTVPSDCYFLLGDNRAISEDSRVYGFIPRENLISKVFFHYQTLTGFYVEWRNNRILNSF